MSTLRHSADILQQIDEIGYRLVTLEDRRLHDLLLDLAVCQVREAVASVGPSAGTAGFSPAEYHTFCQQHAVDHRHIFHKANRRYVWNDVKVEFLRSLGEPLQRIFHQIEWLRQDQTVPQIHGKAMYDPELYFRVVRPQCDGDVPHAHCDYWAHDVLGKDQPTIKIWIPLAGCGAGASFRLMPKSHRQTFTYVPVDTVGDCQSAIPKIAPGTPYALQEVVCEAPHVLLFHRKLLHGEMVNHTATTRFSAEATGVLLDPAFVGRF